MSKTSRLCLFSTVCVLCVSVVHPPANAQRPPQFKLSSRLADLHVEDGQVILQTDAGPRAVGGDEFVRLLAARQHEGESRGRLYRLFDITGGLGLIWITVGFVGQFLFTGRMVVQWIVSEREKRSVVPPMFWWMSLSGSSMLLAYFTWRGDVVGLFGQATGWFIYVRNLYLIYRVKASPPAAAADPGPEPQAAPV